MSETKKHSHKHGESPKKKKLAFSLRGVKSDNIMFIGVFILLVATAFVLSQTSLFQNKQVIIIGKTKITKADLNQYSTDVSTYLKKHPSVDFGETTSQLATDDLVMNAAFKLEASKLNKPLTTNDMLAPVSTIYPTKQAQQQYLQKINSGPNFLKIRDENIAYETKFNGKLLTQKKLLIAEASFDTPYFNKAPSSKVGQLYTNELNQMNNNVLPMFQKNVSETNMAKSSAFDVVAFGKYIRNTDNYQQYFDKPVYSVSTLSNYIQGETNFNDISYTGYIRGKVGKLYGTDSKIATLKNVGDHTNVFASKTGSFMIIRLEGKTGGPYLSWNDFLNNYKHKYAQSIVNLHVSLSTNAIVDPLNAFVASITSIGQAKAYAYLSDCSQHVVTFSGISWDVDANTKISGTGTSFQEYRASSNGLCPGEVTGTAYGNAGDGYTIVDNCYGDEPTWAVNGFANPASFYPVYGGPYYSYNTGANEDNSVGGVRIAIRSDSKSTPSNGPLGDPNVYSGWPRWNPAFINDVGHVHIYFLYHDICTACNCPGQSACPQPPKPPTDNRMSPTCGGVTGFIWAPDGSWKAGDPPTGANNKLAGDDYDVIWDTGGGSGPVVQSGNISTSSTSNYGGGYTGGYSGSSIYGDASTAQTLFVEAYHYFFQSGKPPTKVYDLIGPSPSVQPPGFPVTSAGYTQYLNCRDDQPTASMTVYCGYVSITGLGDGNAPGAPVNFSLSITSGSASETISDTANGNINEAYDTNSLNGAPPGMNGFDVTLTVYDIAASDSGDASAGNLTVSGSASPCFTATCSVKIASNIPNTSSGGVAPDGDVIAGAPFVATVSITNTGLYLDSNLGGNPLGVTNQIIPGNDFPLYNATAANPSINTSLASAANSYASDFPAQSDVPPGYTLPLSINYTAPAFGLGTSYNMNFYTDYYGRFAVDTTGCSGTVKTYVPFTLKGIPTATPQDSTGAKTSDEDPSQYGFTTGVQSTAPVPVDGNSVSTAYHVLYPTVVQNVDSGPQTYNGPYTAAPAPPTLPSPVTTPIMNGAVPVVLPVHAGDKYETTIYLAYTTAYVGPGGPDDIVNADSPHTFKDNFFVVNKPFYKIYGNGALGGGNIANNPMGAANVEPVPILATWNNNYFAATPYDFGGGSEFANISTCYDTVCPSSTNPRDGGIFGLASYQHTIGDVSSPIATNFSNTTNNSGTVQFDQPKLGGKLGGTLTIPDEQGTLPTTGWSTLTPAQQANQTTSASYTASGNTVVGPMHFALGTSVSLVVTGDVYINGDITYDGSRTGAGSWTYDSTNKLFTVPSFVLKATGNIYIAPNVGELDGVYEAAPSSSNANGGGTIYTCGKSNGGSFIPVPEVNLYNSCNKQLSILGSFSAYSVHLMRTYGTLRDEKPTPGSPGTPGTPGTPAVPAVNVTNNGSSYTACGPISPGTTPCSIDKKSVYSYQEYGADYSFASVPARSGYSLTINYQNYQASGSNWPPPPGLKPPYTYSIEIDVNGSSVATPSLPANGSSYNLSLGSLPANPTITIKWLNNYWIAWNGNPNAFDPNFEINSLKLDAPAIPATPGTPGTPGTPPIPPASFNCTNNGGTTSPRSTCAAEVFDFSPENYLSYPNTQGGTQGAINAVNVYNLPPIL
ncbi:MAG: hypothetical protein ACHQT9_01395 [Candidatus Saccharimonadales bacterium]